MSGVRVLLPVPIGIQQVALVIEGRKHKITRYCFIMAVRVFGRQNLEVGLVAEFRDKMPKSKNKRKNAGKKPANAPAVATSSAAPESAAPKVGPIKYVGQVRQEARRVVWPGWPEVWKTTVLVMILFVLMGAFFFVVDWALANIVQLILGLGA